MALINKDLESVLQNIISNEKTSFKMFISLYSGYCMGDEQHYLNINEIESLYLFYGGNSVKHEDMIVWFFTEYYDVKGKYIGFSVKMDGKCIFNMLHHTFGISSKRPSFLDC